MADAAPLMRNSGSADLLRQTATAEPTHAIGPLCPSHAAASATTMFSKPTADASKPNSKALESIRRVLAGTCPPAVTEEVSERRKHYDVKPPDLEAMRVETV